MRQPSSLVDRPPSPPGSFADSCVYQMCRISIIRERHNLPIAQQLGIRVLAQQSHHPGSGRLKLGPVQTFLSSKKEIMPRILLLRLHRTALDASLEMPVTIRADVADMPISPFEAWLRFCGLINKITHSDATVSNDCGPEPSLPAPHQIQFRARRLTEVHLSPACLWMIHCCWDFWSRICRKRDAYVPTPLF